MTVAKYIIDFICVFIKLCLPKYGISWGHVCGQIWFSAYVYCKGLMILDDWAVWSIVAFFTLVVRWVLLSAGLKYVLGRIAN